nr:hypothetical protein Iba_chr09aCG7060 [Ipomoea batatas]
MLIQLLLLKLVLASYQKPVFLTLGIKLYFHWLTLLSMKSCWRLLNLKAMAIPPMMQSCQETCFCYNYVAGWMKTL